jgi:hypothetical protein
MQEIKDVIEITQKRKLMEVFNELQNTLVEQMFLSVDEKGDVHIVYARYRKKTL